jgi:very-short-patch-repair endonuclease
MTDAERLLWAHLRARQLRGMKFRRQMWLCGYIADFACPDAKLVVEADGGQHADQEGYDALRTAAFAREGYRILRFWNHDILTNPDGVLETISAALPSPSQASPGPLPLPVPGEGN